MTLTPAAHQIVGTIDVTGVHGAQIFVRQLLVIQRLDRGSPRACAVPIGVFSLIASHAQGSAKGNDDDVALDVAKGRAGPKIQYLGYP